MVEISSAASGHPEICNLSGRTGAITQATYLGIPVSPKHTITGAIIGVGAGRKVAAIRWNGASNVMFAWIVPAGDRTVRLGLLRGREFLDIANVAHPLTKRLVERPL